jgi:hypothetical protein
MGLVYDQRGVSLIAVIIIMLIMSVMGSVLLSMVGTENTSSVGQMRADQSFYIAEGGAEYGQRFMTDTTNWYFFTTDPFTIVINQPLGAGTFTDVLNLPATALSRNRGAGNTTLCVFTVNRFPIPATIQIDDEIITCPGTGACASTPAFTGCTRGVPPTVAAAHSIGTEVYPVATLSGAISSTATTITVDNTAKFLAAGTIQIGNPGGAIENARYNDITATQFLGVVRGVEGTPPAAWPGGTFVTPLQNTGAGVAPDFQALVTSTGTVANARRVIQVVAEK